MILELNFFFLFSAVLLLNVSLHRLRRRLRDFDGRGIRLFTVRLKDYKRQSSGPTFMITSSFWGQGK